MTPQERELIAKLFDRLAALENAPRDPDAERAIQEGLARAPHAVYALVQTVLVQDEALKAANAKIEELQGPSEDSQPEQPRGFLDTMRNSLFGREATPAQRGSVPSVRPGASPFANAPGYRDQGYREQAPPPMGGPGYGGPAAPGFGGPGGPGFGGYGGAPGGGGSFLGTAAASAAGMIGGSLLLGGIRNMLGGHGHQAGPFASTFDHLSSGAVGGPSGGVAGSGNLSRQAGLDDVGRSPSGVGGGDTRAGFFGGHDEQEDDQYTDDDHDGEDGDGDDYGDDDASGSDDSDNA
ncbi:MAG: DUF2076 domain-containing protein [Hyphomicrobiales bacterium]|nr:DUF2076 domain-containing protein [Hyphomicrobiales bacterium]MBV9427114.1 DUF2076 domain-containing protein [Bradyrhizobiaceae bacterium]